MAGDPDDPAGFRSPALEPGRFDRHGSPQRRPRGSEGTPRQRCGGTADGVLQVPMDSIMAAKRCHTHVTDKVVDVRGHTYTRTYRSRSAPREVWTNRDSSGRSHDAGSVGVRGSSPLSSTYSFRTGGRHLFCVVCDTFLVGTPGVVRTRDLSESPTGFRPMSQRCRRRRDLRPVRQCRRFTCHSGARPIVACELLTRRGVQLGDEASRFTPETDKSPICRLRCRGDDIGGCISG